MCDSFLRPWTFLYLAIHLLNAAIFSIPQMIFVLKNEEEKKIHSNIETAWNQCLTFKVPTFHATSMLLYCVSMLHWPSDGAAYAHSVDSDDAINTVTFTQFQCKLTNNAKQSVVAIRLSHSHAVSSFHAHTRSAHCSFTIEFCLLHSLCIHINAYI